MPKKGALKISAEESDITSDEDDEFSFIWTKIDKLKNPEPSHAASEKNDNESVSKKSISLASKLSHKTISEIKKKSVNGGNGSDLKKRFSIKPALSSNKLLKCSASQ